MTVLWNLLVTNMEENDFIFDMDFLWESSFLKESAFRLEPVVACNSFVRRQIQIS